MNMKWIKQIKYKSYVLTLLPACLLMIGAFSCRKNSGDDWITITPEPLDSLQTEIQLDNILNGGYVWLPGEDPYRLPELKYRSDLRYLPYLYIMFNQTFLPDHIAGFYGLNFDTSRGVYKGGDTLVYKIGACSTDRANYVKKYTAGANRTVVWYPNIDDIEYDDYSANKVNIYGTHYDIDSLRIRVIACNDRSALELLEKYYTSIKQLKELAIYYKVLLSYEGNGDLAEKYYTVLKPYLRKRPEFLNGVREVLLRAAHCDNDRRAQELCDSLGFSLCDYRFSLGADGSISSDFRFSMFFSACVTISALSTVPSSKRSTIL